MLMQVQSINFELYEFVKKTPDERAKIINKNIPNEIKEKELALFDKDAEVNENRIFKKLSKSEKELFDKCFNEFSDYLKEKLPRFFELQNQMLRTINQSETDKENMEKVSNFIDGVNIAMFSIILSEQIKNK